MDNADTLTHGTDAHASMPDAVIEAIGTVLALVARLFEWEKLRHLGGPGLFRQLASALAGFIAAILIVAMRQRVIASRVFKLAAGFRSLRHLRHPPQAWAAP